MTDSILRLYHGEECDPLRPALPVQANGSEWLPGPPGRITEGILEIDLDAYRKLERYRILATCRCGHLEAL
jgi:hypothetical protein